MVDTVQIGTITETLDNLLVLIAAYQVEELERINVFSTNMRHPEALAATDLVLDIVVKSDPKESINSSNIINLVIEKREGELALVKNIEAKLLVIKEELKTVGSLFGEGN